MFDHYTESIPEISAVDRAWVKYERALETLDRNLTSPLAQRLLLSAIRQLRAADPHFTARTDII